MQLLLLGLLLISTWMQPLAVQEDAVTSNPDLMLLAKIIEVEAGSGTLEAKMAVGNVVLNRVADERFPSTIEAVIFQEKQFPPAHKPSFEKVEPDETSLLAAQKVLEGMQVVEGALYFYNPDVTSGPFWSSLTEVAEVGGHIFLK